MLEWDILEDEESHLPEGSEADALPGGVRWRRWLLVLAMLIAGMAGAAWGRVYAQEQQLRADLTEVITREAHLMALGAVEQGEGLVDPLAPAEWKGRYRRYLGRPQTLPGTPELRTVELQQEGALAVVVVAWPTQGEAPAVMERRAYRLYQEKWVRSPLPTDGEPLQTSETTHFVLRAGPRDLAMLTDAPAYHEQLEAIWKHLDTTWEGWEVEPFPITIVVQRLEFESIVSYTSSRRMLRANSPRLTYVLSNKPLPSQAYYKLHLTRAVLRRLLPLPSWAAGAQPIHTQLIDAEARQWILDESQRKALRNSWRETLDGQWYSPFLPPPSITEESSPTQHKDYEQWSLSTALLLDYLIDRHGQDVPGRLASKWLPNRSEFFLQRELPALYLSVAGGLFGELETQAREFALTIEE
ncbi:MAG: hypothetical protein H0T73_20045 [Ardenticatenales bacterium]|nr:hypothetical protein [Ardenticatenales bacterium]